MMLTGRARQLITSIMHRGAANDRLFDKRSKRHGQARRLSGVDDETVEFAVAIKEGRDVGLIAPHRVSLQHPAQCKHLVDIGMAPVGNKGALRTRPDDVKLGL